MVNKNVVIEGARIGFRNFSGKEGRFNPAGRRNFCVFLDEDVAKELLEQGWNVRYLQPRDDDGDPQPYLQVGVTYNQLATKIILVTSRGKSQLDEQSVDILDWAEIENVDLILRPYNWEVSGKKGVKAYLKTMYVTLVEDEFEKKYYDVPDSAEGSVGGCGHCDVCDGSCKHHEN